MPVNIRIAIAIVIGAALAAAYGASRASAQKAVNQIAHGKYLVYQVAMCIDCHGPDLEGAPLPFEPIEKGIPWVPATPSIRGKALDHFTQADLEKALHSGKRPNGTPFLPPMPPFKLNQQDARAVALYLKSLK